MGLSLCAAQVAVQEFNETMLDKFGNEVKVKAPKKKMSRQELKKKEKIRKMRLAQGLPVSDDDEWDE
jgi:elongation factor 3